MNYEAPICDVVRVEDVDVIRTSDTPMVDLETDPHEN